MFNRTFLAAMLAVGLTVAAAGCVDSRSQAHAVYVLVDTSGTYANEAGKAQLIVNYLLGTLQPGDSLAVARVKSRSFSEKDIVAKATFDARPTQANAQKRVFRDQVGSFLQTVQGSAYTDITGGLIQGAEFLNETGAGKKTILIFSDLKEDLEAGYVRDIAVPVDGFDVVALNVTKLRSDNVDPREYIERLESWRQRVEAEGGTWRVINDLDRLEALL